MYKPIFCLLPCIILLCSLPGILWAQRLSRENFKRQNALYFELAGNSDTYAINYERILYQQLPLKAGLRVGIGTNLFFLPAEPNVYPIVPLEAIGLLGGREKHFEFGLGYTRRFTDNPDLLQHLYFGRLGFRYQKPRGGLVVRVALTPFVSPGGNVRTPGVALVPRLGLSVGHSF